MSQRTIDRAIATGIERGQDIAVPNVFAAYFQCLAGDTVALPIPSAAALELTSAAELGTLAQAALLAFERAMDKYPMPSRPPKKTKTKTKGSKSKSAFSPNPNTSSNLPKDTQLGQVWTKMFSAEVEQLRWDYQQEVLRSATGYEDNGCTCLSCGSLAALRDKAALLATEYENLERRLDELEQAIPIPKPRAREY